MGRTIRPTTARFTKRPRRGDGFLRRALFRLDGSAFPVEYRAEPIVRDGELQGAICTFTDITERQAAQTALAEQARVLRR